MLYLRLERTDETLKALVHEGAKSNARLDRVELESLRYDVDGIQSQLGIEWPSRERGERQRGTHPPLRFTGIALPIGHGGSCQASRLPAAGRCSHWDHWFPGGPNPIPPPNPAARRASRRSRAGAAAARGAKTSRAFIRSDLPQDR
ncbi:MAG: hypothetical protein JW751_29090 [Polyangiaceae bacterium]|nr:hypothetical protein [Polyangiaceae bacterium]